MTLPTDRTAPDQFALLGQRRFAPFFWAQFLGAANDNVFKFAVTMLVTLPGLREMVAAGAGRAGDRGGLHPAIPAVLGHGRAIG